MSSELIVPAHDGNHAQVRRPKAVLWDLDGTIADTEQVYISVASKLAIESGKELHEEHFRSLVGASMDTTAEVLLDVGVDRPVSELVGILTEEVHAHVLDELHFRPGARELLAALKEAGIPQAIVSMSHRPIVDVVASILPSGTFAVTVAGDDVVQGKPEPEPYLLAVERLGLEPRLCVAIEDSPPGVAAAVASGVTTIGAPFYFNFDTSSAAATWDSLSGKTVEFIFEAYSSHIATEDR